VELWEEERRLGGWKGEDVELTSKKKHSHDSPISHIMPITNPQPTKTSPPRRFRPRPRHDHNIHCAGYSNNRRRGQTDGCIMGTFLDEH
jgi:hypothetical protein